MGELASRSERGRARVRRQVHLANAPLIGEARFRDRWYTGESNRERCGQCHPNRAWCRPRWSTRWTRICVSLRCPIHPRSEMHYALERGTLRSGCVPRFRSRDPSDGCRSPGAFLPTRRFCAGAPRSTAFADDLGEDSLRRCESPRRRSGPHRPRGSSSGRRERIFGGCGRAAMARLCRSQRGDSQQSHPRDVNHLGCRASIKSPGPDLLLRQ